jgi:hypothetical protein
VAPAAFWQRRLISLMRRSQKPSGLVSSVWPARRFCFFKRPRTELGDELVGIVIVNAKIVVPKRSGSVWAHGVIVEHLRALEALDYTFAQMCIVLSVRCTSGMILETNQKNQLLLHSSC